MRAAERLFARSGVDGVLTRDLVAEAGQSNDSAVAYHFGSREGLLLAVIDKHMRRMQEQWRPGLERCGADAPTAAIVDEVVRPLAAMLRTADGRDFLRITAQLAGRAGIRSGHLPEPVAETALSEWLGMLENRCSRALPRAVAAERVAMMITMLTAALAERARRIEAGRRMAVGHHRYVADLVAMLAAALQTAAHAE